MEKDDKKPSMWFFAEWVSTITIFLACFMFLFYQNQSLYSRLDNALQAQTERSDNLYKMWGETQQDIKNLYRERK